MNFLGKRTNVKMRILSGQTRFQTIFASHHASLMLCMYSEVARIWGRRRLSAQQHIKMLDGLQEESRARQSATINGINEVPSSPDTSSYSQFNIWTSDF